MTLLSIILAILFFILGSFHVYWLFGGQWGLESTIPEVWKERAKASKHTIPLFATFVVAAGLYSICLLFLMKILPELAFMSASVQKWLTLGVAIVFLLRAIGDFRILGLFKSHKEGKFAYADTRLFVPLCLVISIGSAVLYFS